jgi:hypothetical protein
MIKFHDIPRFNMFIMAVLRFLSSARPAVFYFGLCLGDPLHLTKTPVVIVFAGIRRQGDLHRTLGQLSPAIPIVKV